MDEVTVRNAFKLGFGLTLGMAAAAFVVTSVQPKYIQQYKDAWAKAK